ncbi:hypothetical protein [uncultured Gilvimarinus sp.]|uniref:hypothetical protein n=1 Tax=uncultured Gilvimarinus sp. TaxID=1689143 RepID=UPI0030EB3563|tara:strand:+ start:6178 stop:6543 length:366 start_codon:yes stop_codon:yes gene_type:complete
MLRFQLGSDDRLHFASKATYRTDKGIRCGLLILTDRRLYFDDVSGDFHFEAQLADITAVVAETLPEQWPPTSESERLVITEHKCYEFTMADAHTWRKKILSRPALLELFMQYHKQNQGVNS